jgi:transposase
MTLHLEGDPAMKILGMDLGQSKSAWELMDVSGGPASAVSGGSNGPASAGSAGSGGSSGQANGGQASNVQAGDGGAKSSRGKSSNGKAVGKASNGKAGGQSSSGEVLRGSVAMDEDSLRKLLKKLTPDRLVIESGPLAARVHDLAVSCGVAVQVADTTEDAWQWKNVKRKTDADDAAKLARLSALDQINPVHIPAPPVRERRHLLEHRRSLIAERTRCKNRIRSTLLLKGMKLPPGKSGWSQEARAELRKQSRPLADCGAEELWRGIVHSELEHLEQIEKLAATVTDKLDEMNKTDPNVALLRSIPGVGPRTAEVIVTVLDQPQRFASRRQVSAYAGLVPRRFQSGQMDRSGRITKRGSALLRLCLNEAGWSAVRYNPELRAFFLQVGGSSKKRRKQAIVAVMRKLLVIAWAMLRDGKRYQPRAAGAKKAVAA